MIAWGRLILKNPRWHAIPNSPYPTLSDNIFKGEVQKDILHVDREAGEVGGEVRAHVVGQFQFVIV